MAFPVQHAQVAAVTDHDGQLAPSSSRSAIFQPVSQYGINPATNPGAIAKNTRLPAAATILRMVPILAAPGCHFHAQRTQNGPDQFWSAAVGWGGPRLLKCAPRRLSVLRQGIASSARYPRSRPRSLGAARRACRGPR